MGTPLHDSNWSLPLAAWQGIAHHLSEEDALTARLVCLSWAQDVGAFVTTAKALPSQLLDPRVELAAVHSAGPICTDGRVQPMSAGSAAVARVVTCSAASYSTTCSNSSSSDSSTICNGQTSQQQGHVGIIHPRDQQLCSSTTHVTDSTAAHSAAAAAAGSLMSPGFSAESASPGGSAQHDSEGNPWQHQQHPNSTASAAAAAAAAAASKLLAAFPHCHLLQVDVSSSRQQELAALLINSLACSSSSSSSALIADTTAPNAVTATGEPHHQPQQQQEEMQHKCLKGAGNGLALRLSAVPRSFHCRARQDCPCAPPGAAADLFDLLGRLPRQLYPPALSAVHSLELDVFPAAPSDWLLLQGLPCLQELLLPPFMPSLPHAHLPMVAELTQLTALTASVQGSVTSWRSCCESFSSVSKLVRLQHLNLHAFHCPGRSLTAGLSVLLGLCELRLSGRVVLAPVKGLEGLTRLSNLELTQDLQYSALCDLHHSLPGLTHVAVGRITLPPAHTPHGQPPGVAAAVAAAMAAEANQWPLPGAPAAAAAAAAADGGEGSDLDSDSDSSSDFVSSEPEGDEAAAGPAQNHDPGSESGEEEGAPPGPPQQQQPAAAQPPPLPMMPFIAAAAHAPAADPGDPAGAGMGGEVMLEDVGLIVDGLVGNLQEGVIPVHLQRIIERFESIIQLDLTRRGSSSPWAWPQGGPALLRKASGWGGDTWMKQHQQQQQQQQRGPWPLSIAPPGAAASGGGSETTAVQVAGAAAVSSSSSSSLSAHAARQHVAGVAQGRSRAGGPKLSGVGGLQALELALLRPCDVARLAELPLEMRAVRHLGLRLRDQLLAFASVCALRLQPGQLAPLGATFESLTSLCLSGKISLDGQLLRELTAAFGGNTGSSGGCWAGSSGSSGRGLQSLCLDVHFVGVGADDVGAALQAVPQLKVLSVRHRGAGKLLLPVTALPHGLTVLALKKVMIYCKSSSSSSRIYTTAVSDGSDVGQDGSYVGGIDHSSSGGASSSCAAAIGILQQQQQQQQQQQNDGHGGDVGVGDGSDSDLEGAAACELSHALTSPGFTRAALTGSISSPDLTLMAAQATAAATKVSAAAAAAAAGGGGRGGEGVDVCMTSPVLLPNLRRLYLKLCLVPSAALTAMLGLPPPTSSSSTSSTRLAGQQQQQQRPAGPPRTGCFTGGGGDSSSSRSSSSCSGRAVCAVRPPLEVLSVTGDGAARGEACEAWARWLDALKHLTALQVLELAVPEQLGSSLPLDLLSALQSLPRLAHLSLTTSSNPAHLARLARLSTLRTLSIGYTGPPALPPGLLGQLQAGAGPYCRVQLWEQVVMQQQGSFGGAGDAAVAAAGDDAAADGVGVVQDEPAQIVVAGFGAGGEGEAGDAGGDGEGAEVAGEAGCVGAAAAADTAAVQQPHGQQAVAGDQLVDAAAAGLQVTGAQQQQPQQQRGSKRVRVVGRGLRWLCRLRVGGMVRTAAGGLLVFEAGRQLGWLAGRLGR